MIQQNTWVYLSSHCHWDIWHCGSSCSTNSARREPPSPLPVNTIGFSNNAADDFFTLLKDKSCEKSIRFTFVLMSTQCNRIDYIHTETFKLKSRISTGTNFWALMRFLPFMFLSEKDQRKKLLSKLNRCADVVLSGYWKAVMGKIETW